MISEFQRPLVTQEDPVDAPSLHRSLIQKIEKGDRDIVEILHNLPVNTLDSLAELQDLRMKGLVDEHDRTRRLVLEAFGERLDHVLDHRQKHDDTDSRNLG